MKKNYLAGIFVFFLSIAAHGQDCEWLSTSRGPVGFQQVNQGVVINDSGDVITVGFADSSLSIGAKSAAGKRLISGVMAKYTSEGVLKWIMRPTLATSASQCLFKDIDTDHDNNIYVSGEYTGTIVLGPGITAINTSPGFYRTFVAKFNTNGQVLWYRDVGPFNSWSTFNAIGHGAPAYSYLSSVITVDEDTNVLLGFNFYNTVRFDLLSKSMTPAGQMDAGLLKYDKNGNFLDSAKIGFYDNEMVTDIGTDAQRNVYITISTLSMGFTLGSQVFNGHSLLVVKMDSSFNFIRGTEAHEHLGWATHITVRPGGDFVLTGNFDADTEFGGIPVKMQYWGQGFIAYYNSDMTARWVKRDVAPDSLPSISAMPVAGVCMRNNNIYFAGFFGAERKTDIKFGDITLKYTPSKNNLYVVKMDTLGNFLWAFASGSPGGDVTVGAIDVDSAGNAYIVGYYTDKIKVFTEADTGVPTYNLYAAKLVDYTITRGYVSAGPYCAGDSLSIPYQKYGKYDTGNQFIAQLSDSAGNFEGDEVELGRITDTAAGTIKCALPMFDVATSDKYRIRIISTRPVVQSFYRKDTLRLLIYSKDTANAGPDVTLCKGQSIRLGTKGGSRWNWSPAAGFVNAKDSSNRQPLAKPDTTTEYRIIISDSSGCGVTDTDYVVINVRKELNISAPDTVHYCKGRTATVQATATGGNSASYRIEWLYKNGPATDTAGTGAVLNIAPDKPTRYWVKLSDSCSAKNDSAFIVIIPDSGLALLPIADTTICLGNSVAINAKAYTCDTTAVKYRWDNGLDEGAVQTLSPITTTTYTLVAFDTINGSADSMVFTITVRPALTLTVNSDTTICKGETAQLRAIATGGDSVKRKVRWTADNSNWTDTNFTTTVTPDSSTTYIAILSDGCTAKADTAQLKITVRPPLKITLNTDTIICTGETAELRAIASGGLPSGYTVNWKADNSPWTDNKATVTVTPISTTRYTAILSDNCTTQNDSATIKVTVRPPLDVTVNNDTTICTGGSVSLAASVSGGLPAHHILWTEKPGSWTDSNFSATVSPTATTTYMATLTDNCTTNADSAAVTVTVLSPLSVSASAIDSICQGQTATLSATLNGGKTSSRSLSWTGVPGTFTSNQNPVNDTPKINTTYIARLSDNCSPDAYDTLFVVVLPKPKADFTLYPTEGCPPLSVNFTDLSANTDSAENTWHILATEAFGIKNYTYEFLTPGTYSIGLTVGNSLGCVDFINKPNAVTVDEKPTANFTVKPDIKEVGKELLLINNSQKATNYTWNFGDGSTFNQNALHDTNYTYNDSGYYNISLIAQNSKGCKDTSTQLIRVYDRVYCAIPNAFTPGNPDNLNPVFQPVCTGVKSYTLTIYNRWGQIVQECENCAWDGTYMDKSVPSEIYMYKIFIIAESGKKETVFGAVNVLR